METQISQTVRSVLTEASAQPTKARLPITEESNPVATWAAWLKLKTNNDPVLNKLVRECRNLALAFKDGLPPRWITITGDTGTGKTHCGRRLWNHLSARLNWRGAEFIHGEVYWPKFVSELRAGDAFEKYRDMMKWPVLFLDDIGAERDTTGFASEQLNTLLGCRADKWTILTSNLSLENLGQIDPRMADRIIRKPNHFIEVNTKSYALR